MDDTKKKAEEAKADEPLSRRQWLLSLGGAIVLAGTAGQFGDTEAAAGHPLQEAAIGSTTTLPPGLYTASLDHLTHVLTRDEPFVTIPAGAETEYLKPRERAFQPEFLSDKEFDVVRCLVEIILGEDLKDAQWKSPTGGPSSIYEEVAEWIDLMASCAPSVRKLAMALPAEQRALAVAYFGSDKPVLELETWEPDRILQDGLAWLGTASLRMFGKEFMHLKRDEQLRLVNSISDDRTASSQANAGTRFFDLLKHETIRGFYTSRIGLDELDVKASTFHPDSPGCALNSNL